MNFVQMMTEKDTLTENGALTNSTTHNYCLDLFFQAGACRNQSVEEIEELLDKAYAFDALKTKKIIFWAGDIRQGAGERRFFKIALNWLSKHHPNDIQNNLDNIPEFSRWDVIFDLAIDNEILFSYLIMCLSNPESKNHGLLCKWLPRQTSVRDVHKYTDTHGDVSKTTVTRKKRILYKGLADKLRKRLGISAKEYRKLVVEGSKTVEQQMSDNKWNEIEYKSVPSVAMNKYRQAWYRHDKERFEQYLEDVKSGKSTMNAGAIFPHDIISDAIGYQHVGTLTESQMVQWKQLPNWLSGTNKILPICDTSGSMTWENNALAMKISLALGLYISERNEGIFKDAVMTFSTEPKFHYLSGNLNQRCAQLMKGTESGSTDIEKVFHVILHKAIQNNLPQNEMPETVLIISDMQFNQGTSGTNTTHEVIEKMYAQSGYRAPHIVYWNVNGRSNYPITTNDYGAGLISGTSPSILKAVLANKLDPVDMMDSVIETERYNNIR